MPEPVTSIQIFKTSTSTTPSPHTLYHLTVRSPSHSHPVWNIQKRYSQFDTLHKALTTEFSSPPPATLPPKSFGVTSLFGSNVSDPVKIEERRRGLEEYLRGILYSKDEKWRRSKIWQEFLEVPDDLRDVANGASTAGAQSTTTANFTPTTWITEYSTLKSLLTSIRSSISLRDRHASNGDVSAAQSVAMNGKQSLRALNTRLQTLEDGLKMLVEKGEVGRGEASRRWDLVGELGRERDAVSKALSTSSSHSASSSFSSTSSFATSTDRATLLANPSSSRRFGTSSSVSTSSTLSTASPQTLLQTQVDIMNQQDETLTSLSSIIRRQKEIGITIGQELDLQNQLLEEVDESVGRVQGRLKGVEKKLDRVMRG